MHFCIALWPQLLTLVSSGDDPYYTCKNQSQRSVVQMRALKNARTKTTYRTTYIDLFHHKLGSEREKYNQI